MSNHWQAVVQQIVCRPATDESKPVPDSNARGDLVRRGGSRRAKECGARSYLPPQILRAATSRCFVVHTQQVSVRSFGKRVINAKFKLIPVPAACALYSLLRVGDSTSKRLSEVIA